MKTIILTSSGHYPDFWVEVSPEELKILEEAEKKWGTVYEAMQKDGNINSLVGDLLKREEAPALHEFVIYQ